MDNEKVEATSLTPEELTAWRADMAAWRVEMQAWRDRVKTREAEAAERADY